MISIIIPCKEEPYLENLINDLEKIFSNYPYEVKVQTEKGLGYAVMCGIRNCKGNVIVILDSDGSHNPKYLPAMIKLSDDSYDIVIGSRYVAGGKSQDSFIRQIISRLFCWFSQILFDLKVKDCMSGFVIAKRSVFVKYPISNNGFKVLLDILVRSKGRFKPTEYPIVFERRKMGKSKAGFMEATQTFMFMLRLFLQTKHKS